MRSHGRLLQSVWLATSVSMLLAALVACSDSEDGTEPGSDAGQQAQGGNAGGADEPGADASVADAAADSGPTSTAPVTIQYWVQACFSIAVEGGVAVVTDPFTPSPTIEAQVVTVSHEHPDHNAVDGVPGTPEVIRMADGAGEHEVAGITFTAVETFHDSTGGSSRGGNMVFVWEMEGIRFAHLGDLGHVLTDDQIQQIGAVEVLMVPTGGGPTIDAPTAVQVAQQLSPKLIIPMHYQLFGGVGPFLDAVPGDWVVEQPGAASITVTAADFAAPETKVVVLEP